MVFHKPFIKKSLIFAAENRGTIALVAKLVDAPDLGSGVAIRVGSSPIRRTERGEKAISLLFLLGDNIVVYPNVSCHPDKA